MRLIRLPASWEQPWFPHGEHDHGKIIDKQGTKCEMYAAQDMEQGDGN